MSVLAFGATVAALVVGAPAASYDLSVRTEVGQSRLDPRAFPPKQRTAAELAVTGGLVLDSQRWSLRTDYAPRLWTQKLDLARGVNLDHRLLLRSYFRPGPSWNASLALVGLRGVLDPIADAWTDYSPTGAVYPNDKPQIYESLRATADLLVILGARTVVTFTGTASFSRGDDRTARLLLPPQATLGGLLVVAYGAGARDRWSLLGEATSNRTCPGECPDGLISPRVPKDPEPGHPYVSESVFGMTGLRWEHDLSPAVRALLTGGVSFVSEVSLDPARTDVFRTAPGAEAGLSHRAERSGLSAEVLARYAPAIDRANGRVRQTLSVSSSLGWLASPDWTLAAGAAASSALDREAEVFIVSTGTRRAPGDPSSFGTQVSALRRLDGGVDLQLGLRWRWQKDTRSAQGSFSEAGAFVAVDWALARARPPRVQPQGAQQPGPGGRPAGP